MLKNVNNFSKIPPSANNITFKKMVNVKNIKEPTQINQREMCANVECLQMGWLIYILIFTKTLPIYYLLNKYFLSTIYALSVVFIAISEVWSLLLWRFQNNSLSCPMIKYIISTSLNHYPHFVDKETKPEECCNFSYITQLLCGKDQRWDLNSFWETSESSSFHFLLI